MATATNGVDLNKLRELVLDNQIQNQPIPIQQSNRVFADRHGTIRTGDQIPASDRAFASEIHQGVFSSLPRLAKDMATAAMKLPPNTRSVSIDGVTGWLYAHTSTLGDRFQFFIYHDGSMYQTLVVSPDVAGRYGTHDAHLFSDGRICMSAEGGMFHLDRTYAKSCLWAEGFSVVRRGYDFPFSINQ